MRLFFAADVQTWYYPADQTLVVWELLITPPYAKPDPCEDFLLRSLWRMHERFLEDTYDRDQWAGFLSAIGYRKTAPAVFTKAVPSTHRGRPRLAVRAAP